MSVRLTARAFADLSSILDYLSSRSLKGSESVRRSIQKTTELIGEYPRSGRESGEEDLRVLPAGRYPYLIYWSVIAGEAWIVHIRDARRRPREVE